jgi:hypothetical protein
VILILTTAPHRYTHETVEAEPDVDVRVLGYPEVIQSKHMPTATYIFTDVDRLAPATLVHIAETYRRLRDGGGKVLNDPARMLSRFGVLRALHRAGINDFDAYRVEDLEEPRRWPVFLRVEGNHTRPLSGLLHDRAELDAAIDRSVADGSPRPALLIIEYCAEPVVPGLFRKLSAFRIGDRLLGYTCVHDDQWLVKYGKPAIATPELYEEEYRFVAECPFAETLMSVFDIAGVDYGRVDYGLVAGRPQVYEINSNPDLKLRPEPGPVARRNESNELFAANYLSALKAIDTPPISNELALAADG